MTETGRRRGAEHGYRNAVPVGPFSGSGCSMNRGLAGGIVKTIAGAK
jgi:hypothetical protein